EQRESPRGSVLFRQGQPQDGVWVLRSGTVELTVGDGRRPLVVQVLRPGDVEGDIALLLGQPPPYGAHALDDVVCLFLAASSFERLLADYPPVARRWLSSIASRLARSHLRIVELLGRPLAAQVAALLLDEAVESEVRFPQRTLAAMLGVHRQALNRTLKGFERQGAVGLAYGRITLSDPTHLQAVAGR
ncbi:MAG: Crp/Fnr family transcriptional regulator, partial [Actinobacteria bacterium]|nr:Crp/Fnr family transcriptional regulator [Actinomycetota bacterium]